jgi:prepilin-type processing-associated H-X9-DG protein/prepilin-type N-terminal cleavage/methylation domain-containing protein
MRRAAFTVIELVVVVAIIALLISILTPYLTRGRERAQLVVCSANARQIGLSLQAYVSDWQVLPAASIGGTTETWKAWTWDEAALLQRTSGDNATDAAKIKNPLLPAAICPTMPRDVPENWNATYPGHNISYGPRRWKWQAASALFEGDNTGEPTQWHSIQSVRNPAARIMIGEWWNANELVGKADTYNLSPTATSPVDYWPTHLYQHSNGTAMDATSQALANYLFLDGHVEPLTWIKATRISQGLYIHWQ